MQVTSLILVGIFGKYQFLILMIPKAFLIAGKVMIGARCFSFRKTREFPELTSFYIIFAFLNRLFSENLRQC
ncbi:hypothetical protein LEP1GSC051_2476 [Leptospira sp. P2653]|nr:hypothetical protein LEP1GSC051_2476 [Leptospira sp. P2653]